MAGTSTLRNTATKAIDQSQNFQNLEVSTVGLILVSLVFIFEEGHPDLEEEIFT